MSLESWCRKLIQIINKKNAHYRKRPCICVAKSQLTHQELIQLMLITTLQFKCLKHKQTEETSTGSPVYAGKMTALNQVNSSTPSSPGFQLINFVRKAALHQSNTSFRISIHSRIFHHKYYTVHFTFRLIIWWNREGWYEYFIKFTEIVLAVCVVCICVC